MSKRHICARCAGNGPTCCEGPDRDIFITKGDVKRIETFLHNTDFFEYRKPVNQEYLETDDPLWTNYVFREDKSRRVVKLNDSGKCQFLTPFGCTLPTHVRPLICRLFPFQYNASGISNELERECPREFLSQGESLVQALGIDKKDAMMWHQTLYQEILWEKEEDEINHRTHL
jgi:Fe-S-cluster containining protein